MSRNLTLLTFFNRPQWHTPLSIIATTMLVTLLIIQLLVSNNTNNLTAFMFMIFIAIFAITLNDTFLGLINKKRDIAVLLAVGFRKHMLGIILAGKALFYTSLSYLLGLLLAYLLLLQNSESLNIAFNSITTLSIVIIIGPAILAGLYAFFYTYHLNVPEVLRH